MKTVSISLSPNTEKDDLKIAFKELFSREKIKGKHIKTFENNFKNYFDFKSVFSVFGDNEIETVFIFLLF